MPLRLPANLRGVSLAWILDVRCPLVARVFRCPDGESWYRMKQQRMITGDNTDDGILWLGMRLTVSPSWVACVKVDSAGSLLAIGILVEYVISLSDISFAASGWGFRTFSPNNASSLLFAFSLLRILLILEKALGRRSVRMLWTNFLTSGKVCSPSLIFLPQSSLSLNYSCFGRYAPRSSCMITLLRASFRSTF